MDGSVHLAFALGSSTAEPEAVLLTRAHLVPRLAHASHITHISAYGLSESHLITGGDGNPYESGSVCSER